ncbi:hypothetical protein WN51_11198 [Melipona quadrifasciata]|uniref:Uncharacterized protein n=1 Tax=Melipona quadrifasciata TaxID=166423 RepID=A0A0N0U631_9HYME|nr:hypothetical protein WN51_11198 [Melipona quadrifasciata]
MLNQINTSILKSIKESYRKKGYHRCDQRCNIKSGIINLNTKYQIKVLKNPTKGRDIIDVTSKVQRSKYNIPTIVPRRKDRTSQAENLKLRFSHGYINICIERKRKYFNVRIPKNHAGIDSDATRTANSSTAKIQQALRYKRKQPGYPFRIGRPKSTFEFNMERNMRLKPKHDRSVPDNTTPPHEPHDSDQPIANFRCISVAPEEARFSGLPLLKITFSDNIVGRMVPVLIPMTDCVHSTVLCYDILVISLQITENTMLHAISPHSTMTKQ